MSELSEIYIIESGALRGNYLLKDYFSESEDLVISVSSFVSKGSINKNAPIKIYKHEDYHGYRRNEINGYELVIIELVLKSFENLIHLKSLDIIKTDSEMSDLEILSSGTQLFLYKEKPQVEMNYENLEELIRNQDSELKESNGVIKDLKSELLREKQKVKSYEETKENRDKMIIELKKEINLLKEYKSKKLDFYLNTISDNDLIKELQEEVSQLTIQRDLIKKELLEIEDKYNTLKESKIPMPVAFRKKLNSDEKKYLKENLEYQEECDSMKHMIQFRDREIKALNKDKKKLIESINRIERTQAHMKPTIDYEKFKYNLNFKVPSTIPNSPVIYLLYGTESGILKIGRAKNMSERLKLYSKGGILKNDTHFKEDELVVLLFLSKSYIDDNQKYFRHEKMYKNLMDSLCLKDSMEKLDIGVEWYQLKDKEYLSNILKELNYLKGIDKDLIDDNSSSYQMKSGRLLNIG